MALGLPSRFFISQQDAIEGTQTLLHFAKNLSTVYFKTEIFANKKNTPVTV